MRWGAPRLPAGAWRHPGRPAAPVVLAALLVWPTAPARAHDPGMPGAVEAWGRYARCERTGRFEPCWALLSAGARRRWAEGGRGTAAEYDFVRGAERIVYEELRIVRSRRSPARVVLVVRATGRGVRGPFSETREYALVKEGGEWKMDGLRRGLSETLP